MLDDNQLVQVTGVVREREDLDLDGEGFEDAGEGALVSHLPRPDSVRVGERIARREPEARVSRGRRAGTGADVEVIVYLILLALSGLLVGALGRLAVPGPDPMGIGTTIAIGLAGAFLAGLVTWALFGRGYGGILLSVVFAAGIVYLIRRSRGGSLTDPGLRPRRD